MEQRHPLPPFTEETAKQKIQLAEDAWNSKDPIRVSKAYTENSEWRNRCLFINGRDEIIEFLSSKWERELHYKLKKNTGRTQITVLLYGLNMNIKMQPENGFVHTEMKTGSLMKMVIWQNAMLASTT